jgi:predicted amidohydrolase YtcJ
VASDQSTNPPLLLRNGKIITLDRESRIAQAIVVRGRSIHALGTDAEMQAAAGDGAMSIDLGGRAVVPGLIDTHAHMDREGLKSLGPSLSGCRSIDDVLQRVAAAVAAAAPGDWIVTTPVGEPPFYWDGPAALREARLPTRHELDRVSPRNPVYIRPIWGYWRHSPKPETLVSAANTLALAATGIGAATALPSPSITMERDAGGDPTGVFAERGSSPIVELVMLDHASRFSEAQRRLGLRRAMAAYNAVGTTGVFEGHGVAAELFGTYKSVKRDTGLTVRARLTHSPSWSSAPGADPAALATQWAYWAGSGGIGDDMLSLEGLYVDHRASGDDLVRAGAAPYTGWAGFHYDSALALDRLKPVLIAAARNDIRCTTISAEMMETLAEVDREVPLAGRRWIVQHFGPLSPARSEIAQRLGLVLTPLTIRYIYKEGFSEPEAEDFVPLARLFRMGVPVTLASDNAPFSLFHSIWHAVARRDRFGNDVPPQEEKLTREQALRAATINGAYLSFEEHERGTLEPGKLADLAVLSDDPLTCPEDVLPDIRSVLTMVGGTIVHREEGGV